MGIVIDFSKVGFHLLVKRHEKILDKLLVEEDDSKRRKANLEAQNIYERCVNLLEISERDKNNEGSGKVFS